MGSENLEKLATLISSPSFSLRVDDVGGRFAKYFTPEALRCLQTRFTKVNPDSYTKTLFLSARAKSPEGIEKAAEAVAKEVNNIASLSMLLGCLAPLSTIKLADIWQDKDGEYCGFRDSKGVDYFNLRDIAKSILEGRSVSNKPEGAVFVPGDTAVFCFVTVPVELNPDPNLGMDTRLYLQEGEIGQVVFE